MNPYKKERWLTVPQIARLLKCHVNTPYYWIKMGRLRVYLTRGGQYRVKLNDLQAFVKQYLGGEIKLGKH